MTDIVILPELSWCGGSHIQLQKDLFSTILSAIDRSMNCCQFFLGSNQSFTRRRCDKEDINRAVKLATNFNIFVVSHTCYLFNLCGSVKQLCWEGDQVQDKKSTDMIKELEYELSVLSNFKKNGVVVHPGSFKDRKKGMDCIVKTINKINFTNNSLLLLENCAGEGSKIPRNFEELNYIIKKVEKKDNIGVCIDTAHIHGQGDYDLSNSSEVIRMFNEFDKIIGLKYLKLIHLNDSEVELGSKKDRHQLIGRGYIWGKNIDSLKTLIDFCKDNNIPTCLETSPEDMDILFKYDKIWNLKN